LLKSFSKKARLIQMEAAIDAANRCQTARAYAHWALPGTTALSGTALPSPAEDPAESNDDFEQRAARFAQVQTRPEQGLFRDAVFRACLGQRVVGGCTVPEALESTHLLGREWREGHNSATDGILLRRDLHNLYDRGLLRISDAG
jgi:hypothetical protein